MNAKQRIEISAYLDGEAKRPADVERWLRDDPEAAAYYADLQRQQAALGELAGPDVHPAFATRVAAYTREVSMERAMPRLPRVWLPVAAAALVLAVVGFQAWRTEPSSPGLNLPDPDVVMAALEKRAEAGETDWNGSLAVLAPVETETAYEADQDPGDGGDAADEELQLAVAQSFETTLGTDERVEYGLNTLDTEAEEAFRQLLGDYIEQGEVS